MTRIGQEQKWSWHLVSHMSSRSPFLGPLSLSPGVCSNKKLASWSATQMQPVCSTMGCQHLNYPCNLRASQPTLRVPSLNLFICLNLFKFLITWVNSASLFHVPMAFMFCISSVISFHCCIILFALSPHSGISVCSLSDFPSQYFSSSKSPFQTSSICAPYWVTSLWFANNLFSCFSQLSTHLWNLI